ncbi:MAG: S8 family serine peptidase [Bdellovibrionales bacterium]|nr:S8 family serine peptidase [Bdellovibrionales bacterium]
MKHPRIERMLWILSVSALITVWTNEEAPFANPKSGESIRDLVGQDRSPSKESFRKLLKEIKNEQERSQKKGRPFDEIVVAVVDTGVDLNHPMIKDFLWSNPGETGLDSQGRDKSSNGIDDDTNGFIDDVHGWNFVDGTSNVFDDHGHGTHISGIITKNLKRGTHIRIMPLKYYSTNATGQKTLEASNQAIQYAIDQGARVINYSGGGDLPSFEEKSLFEKASKMNIFVVAASGNDGRKIDERGFFPASYEFSNIISVGSTNNKGVLLASSNRGPDSVDFVAPGENIESSLPNQRIGGMTGTSQATAIVTSIVTKLIEDSPSLSMDEVKRRLARTSLPKMELEGLVKNPGLPVENRALKMKSSKDFNQQFQLENSEIQEIYDDPLQESEDPITLGEVHTQKDSVPANHGIWP